MQNKWKGFGRNGQKVHIQTPDEEITDYDLEELTPEFLCTVEKLPPDKRPGLIQRFRDLGRQDLADAVDAMGTREISDQDGNPILDEDEEQ